MIFSILCIVDSAYFLIYWFALPSFPLFIVPIIIIIIIIIILSYYYYYYKIIIKGKEERLMKDEQKGYHIITYIDFSS